MLEHLRAAGDRRFAIPRDGIGLRTQTLTWLGAAAGENLGWLRA